MMFNSPIPSLYVKAFSGYRSMGMDYTCGNLSTAKQTVRLYTPSKQPLPLRTYSHLSEDHHYGTASDQAIKQRFYIILQGRQIQIYNL